MVGSAIDIQDIDGSLKAILELNKAMLKEHGLWMEDPSATPTWVHLDNKPRSDRKYNIFKP
jgi:hypothetical protein